MASVNHPSVSSLSDNKLNALCRGVNKWLSVKENQAKTGIPDAAVAELAELQPAFWSAILICGNKGNYTVRDTGKKNDIRRKILNWFRDNFTSGVIYNKQRVSNEDRLDMGWYASVPPRKEVPVPKAQTFLQDSVKKNGRVYLTVSHNQNTLGKPRDAEGVELAYSYEDPDLNPMTEWHPFGRYTNVLKPILLNFPPESFSKGIWLRGHWYNHNGYSSWSEVITFTIPKD